MRRRLILWTVYAVALVVVGCLAAAGATGHLSFGSKHISATAAQASYGANPFGSGLYGGFSGPATFTPTLNITSPTNNNRPTVTFSTTDATAGISDYKVEIDSSGFSVHTSPYQLTTLSDGAHTITVRATNNTGQSTDGTVSVTVDTSAPNAFTPTLNVASPTANTTPTLTFATTDTGTGVASYAVSVDGSASSTQTSPYLLPSLADGAHTISVRATDAAGNTTDGSVSLTVDRTSPLAFTPTLNVVSPTATATPTVSFSTTDVSTAIDHYGVAVDSGGFTTQTSPYLLPSLSDGTHTIVVRAFDLVGNTTDGSVSVVVDTAAPAAFTPTLDVTSPTSNATPVVSFATTDATTGINHYQVQLDSASFATQTSPYTLPALSDGTHSIKVRAWDGVGHSTDGSVNVTVDTTAPVSFTPTLNVSSPTSNATPTLSFTTTDVTSGVDHYQVRIDSGALVTQISPYVLPLLSDGSHTFTVRAFDAVGKSTDGSVNLTVDTTGPVAFAASLNVSSPTNNTTPVVTFSTTDAISGVDHYSIRLDGGSFSPATSPSTLSTLSDGPHTVTVRATDLAGNTTDASVNVTVDTVAPAAFTPTLDIAPTTHRTPVASFSTTDAASGIGHYELQVDGGGFTTRTSPFTLSPLLNGNHTIVVRAFDNAGNHVDGSVPIDVTSIDPAPFIPTFNVSSPTTNPTPTLSFSTTGTFAIDHYDVAIDGGSFATRTSPYVMAHLADGTHTATVRAIDVDTNSTDSSVSITVDTVSPAAFTPTANVTTPTSNQRPIISFSTTDATSGINHYAIQIDSGSFSTQTTGYQTPLLGEGAHVVTVRAFDNAGNTTDATVNITVAVAGPIAFTPMFNVAFPTSNVSPTMSFWTIDASGINYYQVRIDSGAFFTQTSPYVLPSLTDGSHTITVRAFDNAGNTTDGTALITIDTVGPANFTPTLNVTSPTASATPTVSFSTTDATTSVDHYQVQIDSGTFGVAASPYVVPTLSDGTHVIRIRAFDAAGNHTDGTVNLTVDATTPVAFTPSLDVLSPTADATPAVTFGTSDAGTGVEFYTLSVDGGPFNSATSPATVGPLSDGAHTITVRAWDHVGNSTNGTVNITVDTAAPVAFTPGISPTSPSASAQPTLNFTTSDSGTGVSHYDVKVDSGSFVTRTNPYTLPTLSDGAHSVTVRAYDGLGNRTDGSLSFVIDTHAPRVFTPTLNTGSITSQNTPVVTFATTDTGSGVSHYEVQIDSGAFATQISPYSAPALGDGAHVIRVRAFDGANNITDGTADLTIDTTPPAPFLPTFDTGERTSNPNPTITFSTTDATTTVDHYTLTVDSTSYQVVTSPFRLPTLTRGAHTAIVRAYDLAGNHRDGSANVSIGTSPQTPTPGGEGYRLAGSQGGVYTFGDAPFFGSASSLKLNKPIVGMAGTPDGGGYWLVASDGGVFSFGDAKFFGSTGSMRLNKPIVGMAPTDTGNGYWLVASDGGVFTFGDAQFFGSTASMRLNKPVNGIARTFDSQGYWLVAADGGIFTFGDAPFHGSAASTPSKSNVVGLIASLSGEGYWIARDNGDVLPFGDAQFFGSASGEHILGLAPTSDGLGYWLIGSDGGVFTFGDAPFVGAAASLFRHEPIVGVG